MVLSLLSTTKSPVHQACTAMETPHKLFLPTLATSVPLAAIVQVEINNPSHVLLVTSVQRKLGSEHNTRVLSAVIIPTLDNLPDLLACLVQQDLCAIKAHLSFSLVHHLKAVLQEALELLSALVALTLMVAPV
jgi:hypothetical protein